MRFARARWVPSLIQVAPQKHTEVVHRPKRLKPNSLCRFLSGLKVLTPKRKELATSTDSRSPATGVGLPASRSYSRDSSIGCLILLSTSARLSPGTHKQAVLGPWLHSRRRFRTEELPYVSWFKAEDPLSTHDIPVLPKGKGSRQEPVE